MATVDIQVGSIVTLKVNGLDSRFVCEEISESRTEKIAREDHDYYRTLDSRVGNVKFLDKRIGVFSVGDVIIVDWHDIQLVSPETGVQYLRPRYWVYKKGDSVE